MARIKIVAKIEKSALRNLERRLQRLPARADRLLAKIANETRVNLIRATPKKFTGSTRRGWVVIRRGNMSYTVVNTNIQMFFIEHGTRAHGPVTSRTRRPWANDPGNVKYGRSRVRAGRTYRAARLFIPLTRKAFLSYLARRIGDLEYGTDYVLAKRVKGMRARHIARDEQKKADRRVAGGLSDMISQTIY